MNFCAIYRNNFDYIAKFLIPTFTSFKDFHKFNFYFYSNDSTDGTEELLQYFADKYDNVNFLTQSVGNRHFESGWDLERIQGLAHARNQLLSFRPFANHEWTIFADSNIYFDLDIIDRFLSMEKPNDGVAFSCAGVDYHRACKLHGNCFAYYDMLAVIDSQGRQGFEIAKNEKFKWSCSFPFLDEQEQDQYNSNFPVCVQSAFGGLTFYKTQAINKEDIFYSSQIQKTHAIRNIPIYLEHWDLHDRISKYGKIYVAPIKVYRDELHQLCKAL